VRDEPQKNGVFGRFGGYGWQAKDFRVDVRKIGFSTLSAGVVAV
jgi:hypothetical protein